MKGCLAVGVGLALGIGLFGFGQSCPKVAVVIPETVIIRQIPRPVPDPAAETETIRRFLDFGFNVVDLVHVRILRTSEAGMKEVERLAKQALAGDTTAIRTLATRDGTAADVLVVGEAVSTVTVIEDLIIPGQPRLHDGRARVEMRAIEVATGRIMAAAAVHTGGIDFSAELAGKKSLERAGAKSACALAVDIAQRYPFPRACFKGCSPLASTFGVLTFANRSGVWVRGVDIGQLFATSVETSLSGRGCPTARPMASDYVIEGVITDWKEIVTPAINLPLLSLLFRGVLVWVTVDVRVLDVSTAEFRAFEVTASVSGMEIFGFRFGASARDVARAVADQIAARVGLQCKGK